MWKKKVNGARESLICMTSVGSLWTRHVDSLSWPTLADVLQRSQTHEAKREGWCHSENTQCTNMFRCIPFYLFIDLLIEFSKSWLISWSIFLLDPALHYHCWGKEWGQIWIIFPRSGMKYKTHTRQHFISVYMTWILQPLGCRFLCESWPTSITSLRSAGALPPFFWRFFFRLTLKHWMLS